MSGMNAPMGFRSVAAVTRGLDCPCCKDRRTKREIRRTARRVAKQLLRASVERRFARQMVAGEQR